MTELAISVRLTSNGAEVVRDARATRQEMDALKASAKGMGTESRALGTETRRTSGAMRDETSAARGAAQAGRQLGQESQKAASGTRALGSSASGTRTELAALGRMLGTGRTNMAGLSGTIRSALPAVASLGGETGIAAARVAALVVSAETGSAALAALASPVGIFVAAIAAAGAGFLTAYNQATDFEAKIRSSEQAIAKAGLGWQTSAGQIASANSQIAATSGQAFGDVEQASLALLSSGKLTADQIEQLTSLGALMASTYGGEVVASTNEVAAAFNALGAGDAKFLTDSFKFLDLGTRQTIEGLIFAGKTAEAQKIFLEALGKTAHGQPGSVSGAFSELKSSVGDWVGAMLASFGPIQAVEGWMKSLAEKARTAANEVRQAAYGGGPVRATADVEGDFRGQAKAARRSRDQLRGGGLGWDSARVSTQYSRQMAELRRTASELIAARKRDGQSGVSLASIKDSLQPTGDRELAVPRGGGGSGARSRAGNSGASPTPNDARDAAAALRELYRDLATVTRDYDPARAAADKYAETLKTLAGLRDAGKISFGDYVAYSEQASAQELERASEQLRKDSDDFYKKIGVDPAEDLKAATAEAADNFNARLRGEIPAFDAAMKQAGRDGAEEFRTQGVDAAQAIAQVIGGKLGGTIGKILGVVSGAQTGNFNSVGGKLGGLLTLIAGKQDQASGVNPFVEGIKAFGTDLKRDLKGIFADVFGNEGLFSASLQQTLGSAFAGAQFGKAITDTLGIKGSKTGAAVGSAIGSASGIPGGKEIGAILGSVVGGLFKKTKTGSAAIGLSNGALSVGSITGNSAEFKGQAKGLASGVISGLQGIAEQLGGFISGTPSVSIGIRKGKPVVDPTGQNRTKGAGVVTFAKGDEAGAAAFALADALKDMVISGLSQRVSAALRSSTDIDQALREAVKVDEIEQLLGGFGTAARKTFVDFERQAKERLRLATKYGFDVVALDKKNQEQRAAILEDSVEQATGGLKALLQDLISGEKAPGTLLDRRDALLAQKAELEAKAGSDPAAAAKLAQVLEQLYQISLEAFGTAGAQFAGDRSGIKSSAEAIIAQATAELKAAQQLAQKNAGTDDATTAKLIGTGNALLDEANAQNAEMIALLGKIAGSGSAGGGFGGGFASAYGIGGNIF